MRAGPHNLFLPVIFSISLMKERMQQKIVPPEMKKK